MICKSCQKEIPEGSEFCPFCGEKVLVAMAKNKSSNLWRRISIGLICLIIVLGTGWIYSEIQLEKANKTVRKCNENIEILNKAYLDLKEDNEQLQNQVDNNSGKQFDLVAEYLSNSKTSNGTIGVYSKIFAVKKGESLKINVHWPIFYTPGGQYVGVDNSTVAEVNWTSDNNVIVTGKSRGVAELFFGSNPECTQNRMSSVVICY